MFLRNKIRQHMQKNKSLCFMLFALCFFLYACAESVDSNDFGNDAEFASMPTELYGDFDDDAFQKITIKIREEITVEPGGEKSGDVSGKCPFDTKKECDIWRKKPSIRETSLPKSGTISSDKMKPIIAAARRGDVRADSDAAKPLVERYRAAGRFSRACCREGLVHRLKKNGKGQDHIYKFIMDDANFYRFSERCMFLSDFELDNEMNGTINSEMVADVRNVCICRNREWISSTLGPFQQVYDAVPSFRNQPMEYAFVDDLGRETIVSINEDVQKITDRMAMCP